VDTLAVQLTLPLAGCVEDFHLQVSAPCRAQQAKARRNWRAFFIAVAACHDISCSGAGG
jgi:hypothetical protein